jgi:wyosine [tRNA(Phe)-imidazoG37] synthetase (radical SAM superfamily)
MIRSVKEITNIPVAVITNGALLFLPQVRDDLQDADAVLPSLDAGSAPLYKKINRAHPGVPFDQVIAGLIAFRQVYQGKLWVETMMVHDVNDTVPALRQIAGVLEKINPDEIHINQPIRPPAESWVEPTDQEGLLRARAILGEKSRVFTFPQGHFDLGKFDDLADAIITIITRHPMRHSEIESTLNECGKDEISKVLNKLEKSGKAQIVERYGVQFWSGLGSYYTSDK